MTYSWITSSEQASIAATSPPASFLIHYRVPAHIGFFLNCSYDKNLLKQGQVVFPDDIQKYGKRKGPLEAADVVSLLWRDRMVPEWIGISIWETDEQATYFHLMCCGRFTSQAQRLYYSWTDVPPFGVKGPAYPIRLSMLALEGKSVEKFSLAESREGREQYR